MTDIAAIASQVKHNCNISDAGYWGYYSPCGLLLRMRDLYRAEHAIKPRQQIRAEEIGTWLTEREALWQELENSEYRDIEISGRLFRPFDAKGINAVLEQQGYVYSAGYGNFLKPLFVLARCARRQRRGRFTLYMLGPELARGLATSPAMIQGNTIILRSEAMNIFFWGKYEEMRTMKCSGVLSAAFAEYGLNREAPQSLSSERLDELMETVAAAELDTLVHHEIGEASQRRVMGRWWKELLAKLPYSRAELFLRALKDVMADTCASGTLAHIIGEGKRGSLAFYVALLDGYRKLIFPEIMYAYGEFTATGNWGLIEQARVEGYKRAGDSVMILKALSGKRMASAEMIEEKLIPGLV
ncbi:MAG: hypothetical protein JSU90_06285 [Nitrospiraceae bacterium]|nr:MAG: hypothetical protein JSU90_06285 [Nitrospiraceae bacterium]